MVIPATEKDAVAFVRGLVTWALIVATPVPARCGMETAVEKAPEASLAAEPTKVWCPVPEMKKMSTVWLAGKLEPVTVT
jgi:hypothetical protein